MSSAGRELGRRELAAHAASNMRALAPQYAHPAAGELTAVGESFKQSFGIPWIGQSP